MKKLKLVLSSIILAIMLYSCDGGDIDRRDWHITAAASQQAEAVVTATIAAEEAK